MDIVEIRAGCPDSATADRLADELLELRLVAVAHLLPPHETRYRWSGQAIAHDEVTLVLRTRAALFDEIVREIEVQHPFELPSVVAVPLQASPSYRDWIHAATGGA